MNSRSLLPFTYSTPRLPLSIFLLVLVYVSGLIGMATVARPWFVALTPLSLALSLALLIWNHEHPQPGHWWWFFVAYVVGLVAEMVGVNTGLLFGDYQYGTVLGPKIWATPWLIGVNWVLVTYCANEAVHRYFPGRFGVWGAALAGAVICTAFDYLIEPAAIGLGFWSWAAGLPPLHNYVGWLVVSLVVSLAYQWLIGPSRRNAFAPVLLLMQIVFFAALRMFVLTT